MDRALRHRKLTIGILSFATLLGGCQPSVDASVIAQPPEAPPTPIELQPMPIPDWVAGPVGSSEHPIGMLTAFTRCEASGVFPANAGEAIYKDEQKDTTESRARQPLEHRFFNSAAKVNSFYGISEQYRLSGSVQYPARAFAENLDRQRADFPPRKEEFETTPEFELRKQQYAEQTAALAARFYYIVADHLVYNPGMLPKFADERVLKYDADGKAFKFSEYATISRAEDRIKVTYVGDEAVREEDRFFLGPNVRVDYKPLLQKIRIAVPREQARELSPYLVAVVHAERSYNPETGDKVIAPLSLEVRNICTGEKLTALSFDAARN